MRSQLINTAIYHLTDSSIIVNTLNSPLAILADNMNESAGISLSILISLNICCPLERAKHTGSHNSVFTVSKYFQRIKPLE